MQTACGELRSARDRLAVPSASPTAARPLSRRMGESAKTKGIRVGSRSAVGTGLHGHAASHCGSSSSGGHRRGGDGGLLGLGVRRQHRACGVPMPAVRLELLRRAANSGAMGLGVRHLRHRDWHAEVPSRERRRLRFPTDPFRRCCPYRAPTRARRLALRALAGRSASARRGARSREARRPTRQRRQRRLLVRRGDESQLLLPPVQLLPN